jgi:hypothetical protein
VSSTSSRAEPAALIFERICKLFSYKKKWRIWKRLSEFMTHFVTTEFSAQIIMKFPTATAGKSHERRSTSFAVRGDKLANWAWCITGLLNSLVREVWSMLKNLVSVAYF